MRRVRPVDRSVVAPPPSIGLVDIGHAESHRVLVEAFGRLELRRRVADVVRTEHLPACVRITRSREAHEWTAICAEHVGHERGLMERVLPDPRQVLQIRDDRPLAEPARDGASSNEIHAQAFG